MEKIGAELVSTEEKIFIRINDDPEILIPISEDNALNIKTSFNSLIKRLRKGVFEIELKETENDLFYQVAKEYIGQLNGELVEVYDEMQQCGFVDEEESES